MLFVDVLAGDFLMSVLSEFTGSFSFGWHARRQGQLPTPPHSPPANESHWVVFFLCFLFLFLILVLVLVLVLCRVLADATALQVERVRKRRYRLRESALEVFLRRGKRRSLFVDFGSEPRDQGRRNDFIRALETRVSIWPPSCLVLSCRVVVVLCLIMSVVPCHVFHVAWCVVDHV